VNPPTEETVARIVQGIDFASVLEQRAGEVVRRCAR
jgi:hypothetical protein